MPVQLPPPPFPLDKKWYPNCFTLVLGPTRSGKTNFFDNLLYVHRFNLRTVVAFNCTEDSNHNYGPRIDDVFVHTNLTEEALADIVKRAKMVTDQKPPGCNDCSTFVILDDIEKCPAIKSPHFSYIIKKGRNDNIGVAGLWQYLNSVPKDIREQPEFVFFQSAPSFDDLHKTYASSLCSKELFRQHCMRITARFGTGVLWMKDPDGQHFYYVRSHDRKNLPPFKLNMGTQHIFADLVRLPPAKRKKYKADMNANDYLTTQITMPDEFDAPRKRK
jgi:hypothetical protein